MEFIGNFITVVYHLRYHIAVFAVVCIGVACALTLGGDQRRG